MSENTDRPRPGRPSRRGGTKSAAREAFDRLNEPVPGQTSIDVPSHHDDMTSHHHDVTKANHQDIKPAPARPVRTLSVRLYNHDDSDALDRILSAARRSIGTNPGFDRMARELVRMLAENDALAQSLFSRMAEPEKPAIKPS